MEGRKLHLSLHLFLALVVICPVSSLSALAQAGAPYALLSADATFDSAKIVSRARLEAHMSEQGIPGVTVAVSVAGRIVWAEGFGLADVENRLPVWPHTKMRVGSVSKSLTSAAIGLLLEQGKLELDAPIQTYVPSFPKKKYPISTRQVAGHLAGIRHYRGAEFLSSEHYSTVEAGLQIFANDTLIFKPGEKYSYSSYGWNLVSAVIEGASGQDFLTYMRDQVFLPLAMRETVPDEPAQIIYNRTRFYVRDDKNQLLNAPFVDNSYKWAGGGFLSTAEDIVRFGHAMLSETLLKQGTVEVLFASLKTSSGEETNYGLGWRLQELDGRRVVGHTGGSVGGTSILCMLPDEKIVVALICNLSQGRLSDLALDILAAFSKARQ